MTFGSDCVSMDRRKIILLGLSTLPFPLSQYRAFLFRPEAISPFVSPPKVKSDNLFQKV